MDVYILRDDDPAFGHFCAQSWMPDMTMERHTISEVRQVTIPDQLWKFAVEQGGLPEDVDHSNDSTWTGHWNRGTTVWRRNE